MNEHKRQAYLTAMGVQAYYPRISLAAAKSSPRYDFAALADPDNDQSSLSGIGKTREFVSEKPGSLKSEIETGVPSDTRRLLDEQIKPVTRSQQTGPEPVVPAATEGVAAAPESELKFCLRYYRINEDLAVIDEVPHQQQQAVATAELLQAILLALGIKISDGDITSESFDWPLAPDLPQDSSRPEHAKQALTGFIKQRKQRDGFSNLLVFAAQLTDLLDSRPNSAGKNVTASDFRPAAEDYDVSLTHSLSAMLAHPMLKKEVWQQLQPLRWRLNPVGEDKDKDKDDN